MPAPRTDRLVQERRSQGAMILVALITATAVAMLLPAAVGFTLREHVVARAFTYCAALSGAIGLLIYVASRGLRSGRSRYAHPFFYMISAYLVIPLLMAVPLAEALPQLGLYRAWIEMLSAFTTTGATVLTTEAGLPIHLWRALAGWGGGLFFFVAVTALLGPFRLGGAELFRSADMNRPGPGAPALLAPGPGGMTDDPADHSLRRLRDHLALIAPVYLGLTLVLWVSLSIFGKPPILALILAMSTVSTSGIAPTPFLSLGGMSELVIAAGMILALSRRFWPGAPKLMHDPPAFRRDPELQLAGTLILAVLLVLGVRAAVTASGISADWLTDLWAIAFNSLSFLTTTGFVSSATPFATGPFSGAAGIVLLALALCGGGVATTAGGLKLMRVFALFWQARREMEKLVYPVSVGGDGPRLRALRRDGAFTAWLFVMIFVFALTALTAALTLTGVPMEAAMIYATSALTTTGPLSLVTATEPLPWSDLGDLGLGVLGIGMVLGRLELLLLISIFWRD